MKDSSSKGLGLCDVLAVVFIVLKLIGVIDWSWYVAIGQTLDEGSVLDEMFTENVTQARSELTVEYNQGLYDKLDAGDFYSRLTARQSELSSQFSSGSADPGTGSSTDSDNSGEKDGGSTGSGD